MFETFHGFQGKGFDLIVEDLLALPQDPPVLVEGFRLLPRLVAPLLTRPDQAVWLIPTPAFRRAAFASRGTTWTIPDATSDPPRALQNLLARDDLFSTHLAAEAVSLQLTLIEVDIGLTVDDLATRVAAHLRLT